MRTRSGWRWAAVASLCSVIATEAIAVRFYSIDAETDELIIADASSGQVEVVAGLGRDLIDPDLAIAGATLYVLNSHVGVSVEILSLDLEGKVLSAAEVRLSGTPIINGEGLVNVGGQLYASAELNPGVGHSHLFGELDPAGTLGPSIEYSLQDTGADLDGIAVDSGGKILAIDGFGEGGYRLVEVGVPSAPSYQLLGTHPEARMNAMTSVGSDLWAVHGAELHRLDPATGTIIETWGRLKGRHLARE